jgi:hypothetical protein
MSKFEGDYMAHQSHKLEQEVGEYGIIANGLLGEGNLGSFGPNCSAEARHAADYANHEYALDGMDESSCMDDRGEGLGVQLPGNRSHSEVIAEYMDEKLSPEPISLKTAKKTQELVYKGKTPRYHGDKTSGLKGCAAVLYGRNALQYLGENAKRCAGLTLDRLRLLGIDTFSVEDLAQMATTGGERAADDKLWDIDPETLIGIAKENGAEYEEFSGAHHTAGPREDFSPHGFDNGRFRQDHRTDDGNPLGALSLTYGLYIEQLQQEGFSDEEIAQKTAGVVLYSVAMLKLACKDEAVDVYVGYGVVN